MRKFFTFKISDEPYKTTTALNKTVDAIYEGPRFLALCVHTPTGEIRYIARQGETEAELEMSYLVDDDPTTEFIVLDADQKTFEAAYLTGLYTHDPIPDYVDVLSNGKGTYTYTYSGGGITLNYYGQDMFYRDGDFTTPRFREHAVTRESVLQGVRNLVEMIVKSLAENDYTDAERTEMEEYKSFLESLSTAEYANVDHWKFPFPANPPRIY
jgi:hypothetical protein